MPTRQSNLKKEEQGWRHRTSITHIKLYYKAIVMKIVWHWHTDQWNTVESPEINLHIYSQLIFGKGAKTIQWRKDGLFNGTNKIKGST